jgi:hypothetical protein
MKENTTQNIAEQTSTTSNTSRKCLVDWQLRDVEETEHSAPDTHDTHTEPQEEWDQLKVLDSNSQLKQRR